MNINFSQRINFEAECAKYPVDIVLDCISLFDEQTKGFVSLGIKEYKEDLNKAGSSLLAPDLKFLTHTPSVQERLGDISKSISCYEVYFYSNLMDQFKYRIMFIENGIGGFPAKVYLANEILKCINENYPDKTVLYLETEDDFVALLDLIFESEEVIKIVQEVVNAVIRKINYEKRISSIEKSDNQT